MCSAYVIGRRRKYAEHETTPTTVWFRVRHVWEAFVRNGEEGGGGGGRELPQKRAGLLDFEDGGGRLVVVRWWQRGTALRVCSFSRGVVVIPVVAESNRPRKQARLLVFDGKGPVGT